MSVWHRGGRPLDALAMCLPLLPIVLATARANIAPAPQHLRGLALSFVSSALFVALIGFRSARTDVFHGVAAALLSGVTRSPRPQFQTPLPSLRHRQRWIDIEPTVFQPRAQQPVRGRPAVALYGARASGRPWAPPRYWRRRDRILGASPPPCWCRIGRGLPLLFAWSFGSRETLRAGATACCRWQRGEVWHGYCADRNRRAGLTGLDKYLEAIVVDASPIGLPN